jgi:uncharacterized protein YdhG (YjbR/CyaY superfamily)
MKLAISTDAYISSFPASTQKLLQQMRTLVLKSAPGSVETMKYGMPTIQLYGKNVVHYAAYANHIGFYPAPSGLDAFKEEISKYKHSKGAVQFPLDKPLPKALVAKITLFRVAETHDKYGIKNPFSSLGAPAQRALKEAGITDLKKLSKYTEDELLHLHGLGPASIPKLKKALASAKLSFMKG